MRKLQHNTYVNEIKNVIDRVKEQYALPVEIKLLKISHTTI